MSHQHIEGLGCSCCSPLWQHIIPKNLCETVPEFKSLAKPVHSADSYQLFETQGGGTIQTLAAGENQFVDALLVKNDKIFAVGTIAEVINEFAEQTGITDKEINTLHRNSTKITGSQTLLPGLIEPHVHILSTAWLDSGEDLGPFEGQELKSNYNRESVLQQLQDKVDEIIVKGKNADGQYPWIIGNLLDPSLFNTDGKREFNKRILDNVSAQVPMFIMNASMHIAYVNEAAINTVPKPDKVPKDGVLNEMEQILPFIQNSGVSINLEEVNENVDGIFARASSLGVTYMHDAGILPNLTNAKCSQEEYLKIKANLPETKVRIGGALVVDTAEQVNQIVSGNEPKSYVDNDNLNISFIKVISDGSNQGLTGKMSQNYCCNDDYKVVEDSGNTGEFNFPHINVFNEMVATVCQSKWSLMIHANGDEAIDRTIKAYEQQDTVSDDSRHRIEHASLLVDSSLDRMKAVGVSPSFLIGHVGYWGYVFKNTIFGQQRADLLDRCKSALDKGMRITLHSDNSVTPLGPLRQMEQSITRVMEGVPDDLPKDEKLQVLNEKEQLSRFEALKAMTYDAAWQCNMEQFIGSLEVNKFADMVILEQSPLTYVATENGHADDSLSAMGMRNIPVVKTFKGGKQTYPHK